MKSRSGIVALALLLLSSLVARAASPSYLSPTAVDPLMLLPAPPAGDSAEDREELDLILAIQQKRTPADVARCESEVELTPDAFTSVMGPWFAAANLPETAKLFKALKKDSKPFADAVKNHYQRPRPKHEDGQIHVPIDDDTSFAYPSGHATRGMLYALILAEVAPEHRDALLERGREIGWDRVVAGLHHPSDVSPGRVLGQALAQSLLADPKFQDELATIKGELKEAAKHSLEPAGAH